MSGRALREGPQAATKQTLDAELVRYSARSDKRSMTNGHAHCAIHIDVTNNPWANRAITEGSTEGGTAALSAGLDESVGFQPEMGLPARKCPQGGCG